MIYNMRGNKLFVMKSGSSWNQVENVNFIYPTDTLSSLTTTAKTVPGAIDELRRGLSGIKVPTNVSELNNDSGFIGYPDVIVINKGSMDAEVDLDNDIPLGRNTILLTGRVVYNTYEHELVFVYRDRESSNSFTTYTLRGDKVVVSKSNGKWSITSSTSFIYRDNANSLNQKITDNTLTTTAKTIPTAINELKSGLNGIKVPTKTSELTKNSGFITTIPDEYITETELNAKGYLTSHQDISNLQTKTDNNLTTTSKEVVGAINEVKSLNDTKLNKTDANKLNCVVIDTGSLKEYILTNFTGAEEKTYHLIANPTCTDLPKASNFYITVETPGMYTYKVTAKELNDSNGIYVCTYRTTSSSWTAWEKVLITGDITTTISDSSTDTQVPSAKAVYDELQEVFQSVSNGKNLIASAITDKGVDTLADATFEQMADNIEKISGFEAIPFAMGTINFNSSRNIIIDISKTYFVITGLEISNAISTNRMAQYSIINGVINSIIQSSPSYSECSLSENNLTIKNKNTAGYSLHYTVLEM